MIALVIKVFVTATTWNTTIVSVPDVEQCEQTRIVIAQDYARDNKKARIYCADVSPDTYFKYSPGGTHANLFVEDEQLRPEIGFVQVAQLKPGMTIGLWVSRHEGDENDGTFHRIAQVEKTSMSTDGQYINIWCSVPTDEPIQVPVGHYVRLRESSI